jgi:hypothetical protein
MKKLSILSLLFIGLLAFNSCETEDDVVFVTSDSNGAVVKLPDNGTAIVLDIMNPMNTASTIVWDEANYGVPTAVSYNIQLALGGTEFATPVDAGATNNNFFVWTNEQLNNIAIDGLGLTPFTEASVDLRVRSTVGDAGQEAFSNTITLFITPYTTDLPRLAVAGNHQGWNPDINEPGIDYVPFLASSAFDATDFEGFVYLDGGYKFVEANNVGEFVWGNKDWGDDGSFSGALISTDESNCEASAGYYWVQVNTDPNGDGTEPGSYSATPLFWAITGSATPADWPDGAEGDQGQRMVYNQVSKKWEITIALTAGNAYKFRANDDWGINMGTDDNDDGSLDFGGGDFSVSESGTYFVELDLSNPRAYTQTITLQ